MMYNTKNLSHPLVLHYSRGFATTSPPPFFFYFIWELGQAENSNLAPWPKSNPGLCRRDRMAALVYILWFVTERLWCVIHLCQLYKVNDL